MLNKLMLISILFILLILFLSPGCAEPRAQETIEAKSYIVRVYTVDWVVVELYLAVMPESYDIVKAYMENEIIRQNTKINNYQATEIISYTENSIRFVDRNGKERFITADYIEVEQR